MPRAEYCLIRKREYALRYALNKLCFVAAGLCCIDPKPATDVFGVVVLLALIAFQIYRRRKQVAR